MGAPVCRNCGLLPIAYYFYHRNIFTYCSHTSHYHPKGPTVKPIRAGAEELTCLNKTLPHLLGEQTHANRRKARYCSIALSVVAREKPNLCLSASTQLPSKTTCSMRTWSLAQGLAFRATPLCPLAPPSYNIGEPVSNPAPAWSLKPDTNSVSCSKFDKTTFELPYL